MDKERVCGNCVYAGVLGTEYGTVARCGLDDALINPEGEACGGFTTRPYEPIGGADHEKQG